MCVGAYTHVCMHILGQMLHLYVCLYICTCGNLHVTCLHLSPLVAIYMFTFVIGRSGARNEEAGGDQEGCHATLCVAIVHGES